MRSNRYSRRAMAQMNVVPYIDVMLVLLVIFMTTVPLISPAIVNLPNFSNADSQEKTPIVVNIKAHDQMLVQYKEGNNPYEQEMSGPELLSFLKNREQSNCEQPVVIAAEKTLRYELVIDLMSDLKAEGVKRIGLLVKQK
ncbi:ExbD/TolR family protein [Candidatus Pandoraea novymonadis]|nr:ExbD/TolR family protein [Candidatus Pandoraea novymonadis]